MEKKEHTDLYMWQVKYEDHTWIAECGQPCPEGRGWATIDHARTIYLELLPAQQGLPFHGVQIPPGAQPVFFRRRQILLDEASVEQGRHTVHCIGWKRDEQAAYLFVFEDGTTLLTSDFQAV